MRFFTLVLAAGLALPAIAQEAKPAAESKPLQQPETAAEEATRPAREGVIRIPAGTRVPLQLKHALTTKSAKPGDGIYAETNFPVVIDEKVVIPAGTYVQGVINTVKRAGRVKGQAEILLHFKSLVYPNGYTVLLPGAVESNPGAEDSHIKDDEGTIQRDSEKGRDAATVGSTAATGALIGAAAGRGKGALTGGAIGTAVGLGAILLGRGSDVRMEAGTTLEMVIQRPIDIDYSRVIRR